MNQYEAPGERKGPLQQGKVRVRRTMMAQVGITVRQDGSVEDQDSASVNA